MRWTSIFEKNFSKHYREYSRWESSLTVIQATWESYYLQLLFYQCITRLYSIDHWRTYLNETLQVTHDTCMILRVVVMETPDWTRKSELAPATNPKAAIIAQGTALNHAASFRLTPSTCSLPVIRLSWVSLDHVYALMVITTFMKILPEGWCEYEQVKSLNLIWIWVYLSEERMWKDHKSRVIPLLTVLK